MSTTYIAETDDQGDVTCVWCKKDKDRFAHPLKPHTVETRELRSAEFHGADRALIADWLAAPEHAENIAAENRRAARRKPAEHLRRRHTDGEAAGAP